jgi:hypothetical protein
MENKNQDLSAMHQQLEANVFGIESTLKELSSMMNKQGHILEVLGTHLGIRILDPHIDPTKKESPKK